LFFPSLQIIFTIRGKNSDAISLHFTLQKSYQLLQKGTQQMALVPYAQRNSKPPGLSAGYENVCSMHEEWLQTPLFRVVQRFGVIVLAQM
jgi:hypothetical protein